MADHPRFGPAGVPPLFRMMKASLEDVPKLLREEGLDAFEYQAVRWGKKPQMRREGAEKLGLKAKDNDVWLSVHGSYFINFCGDKAIVEASKQRLIACAIAAAWMDAHIVVFHPGFYSKRSPKEIFETCSTTLKDAVENMKTLGIEKIRLGLETMGKVSQFGSLDEVLSICETVENAQPVIDWSHLYARSKGDLKTADDFRKIIEEIEKRLGTKAAENLHCHFTKVEFTDKGEKRHRTLDEKEYGPDFELFAKVIVEHALKPVIISESPLLDIDAVKMRDILRKEIQS